MLRSSATRPCVKEGKELSHKWTTYELELEGYWGSLAVLEPMSSRWPLGDPRVTWGHSRWLQSARDCNLCRLNSGFHCSLIVEGHGCLYLHASDFTAHCEVRLFFLFITLMLFDSVFFIRVSERKNKTWHGSCHHQVPGWRPCRVWYKSTVAWRGSGSLSCLLDRVSVGTSPSVCMGGRAMLKPILASSGTNGFLPIGGAPDPSFQCIPKAPRCWHPASPNNCCKQLAANGPTLGPLSPASPLARMIALILGLIEGEQQGGDLPGIHSLAACPSEHASSTYLSVESEWRWGTCAFSC